MINYNEQEKQEVLNLVKRYLQDDEFGFTFATLVNYQEQEDDETDDVYYEVYESTIMVNEDTTLEEMQEMQIEKEELVKTYKTKRDLLNAFLKAKDAAGSKYKIYTRL